jgi:hypothetical protein
MSMYSILGLSPVNCVTKYTLREWSLFSLDLDRCASSKRMALIKGATVNEPTIYSIKISRLGITAFGHQIVVRLVREMSDNKISSQY